MEEKHLEPSPRKIIETARKVFDEETRSKDKSFSVFRGLRHLKYENPDLYPDDPLLNGYNETLPQFKGKDFITLVNEEVARREERAEATGEQFRKIVIVDVGFGAGRFLLDCDKKWEDKVELIGYGSDKYTKTPVEMPRKFTYLPDLPPTHEAIEKAQIKLVEGNAIDIRKKLGDNFADLIISCYTLRYIPYPDWEMIKKFYRVLKTDGIGLIHEVALHFEPYYGKDKFIQLLSKEGYDFDIEFYSGVPVSIAFRKTHSDIELPIRTVGKLLNLRGGLDKPGTRVYVPEAKLRKGRSLLQHGDKEG